MYGATFVGLSEETWESLPEDLQNIMTEIAEEYMFEHEPALLSQYEEAACTKLLEEGATVALAPEEEVTAWKERVGDSILEAWYDDVQSLGVPRDVAEKFYQDYITKLRSYEAESPYRLGVAECAARSPDPAD